MTTTDLAQKTSTKYFIEYVCSDLANTYFQLVRKADAAILCAYKELTYIFSDCFELGINKSDVTMW